MTRHTRFWCIVPAAGIGKRMQADCPKQYLTLPITPAMTILEHTLMRLLEIQIFEKIVVAISDEDCYWDHLSISKSEKIMCTKGGAERADSVLSCLHALQSQANEQDWVLVHDAARPCITAYDIKQLIDKIVDDNIGGILALPSNDTLKKTEKNIIVSTLDRRQIWRALTPQMFRYGMLKHSLEQTKGDQRITDEASALEALGLTPKIVEGRFDNIKVTHPEDLTLAAFFITQQNLAMVM
jgi:2-C-methyl-D-erythritol 4-phosphate cytidylyltransferase